MSEAILFPGQGAQFPGMGRDWCETFPVAAETFQQADAALGFSLSDSIWNCGDDVHRTDLAQPGILATSVAIVRTLVHHGLELESVPLVAGLSLGEYSALWCAGSLTFEDAIRLVRLRGEAMQAASESIPSGMVSLMGATPEQAQELAKTGAAHGICSVANFNAPGQIVSRASMGPWTPWKPQPRSWACDAPAAWWWRGGSILSACDRPPIACVRRSKTCGSRLPRCAS